MALASVHKLHYSLVFEGKVGALPNILTLIVREVTNFKRLMLQLNKLECLSLASL